MNRGWSTWTRVDSEGRVWHQVGDDPPVELSLDDPRSHAAYELVAMALEADLASKPPWWKTCLGRWRWRLHYRQWGPVGWDPERPNRRPRFWEGSWRR